MQKREKSTRRVFVRGVIPIRGTLLLEEKLQATTVAFPPLSLSPSLPCRATQIPIADTTITISKSWWLQQRHKFRLIAASSVKGEEGKRRGRKWWDRGCHAPRVAHRWKTSLTTKHCETINCQRHIQIATTHRTTKIFLSFYPISYLKIVHRQIIRRIILEKER